MEYYIEKIIELIKDEVTYYIKPELMKSYFEQINFYNFKYFLYY